MLTRATLTPQVLTPHSSPFTPQPSPLSALTPHPSPLTPHSSLLTTLTRPENTPSTLQARDKHATSTRRARAEYAEHASSNDSVAGGRGQPAQIVRDATRTCRVSTRWSSVRAQGKVRHARQTRRRCAEVGQARRAQRQAHRQCGLRRRLALHDPNEDEAPSPGVMTASLRGRKAR